jgi:hypothetical protein
LTAIIQLEAYKGRGQIITSGRLFLMKYSGSCLM